MVIELKNLPNLALVYTSAMGDKLWPGSIKVDLKHLQKDTFPFLDGTRQCSSLKCANAFQCEGLQNNHTSLKLSNFFSALHQKKNLILAILY